MVDTRTTLADVVLVSSVLMFNTFGILSINISTAILTMTFHFKKTEAALQRCSNKKVF